MQLMSSSKNSCPIYEHLSFFLRGEIVSIDDDAWCRLDDQAMMHIHPFMHETLLGLDSLQQMVLLFWRQICNLCQLFHPRVNMLWEKSYIDLFSTLNSSFITNALKWITH